MTDLGLNNCHGTLTVDDPCEAGRNTFAERFALPQQLSILLTLVPLLVGLFAGAPLVARELEHGTHRLVWMQGVTRRRWLLVKVVLVLAGAAVFAAALSALVYWWWTPYERVGTSRFEQLEFDLQGLAPVGYTIFAVALGVAAGTLVPKVLPAMAVTVAGFIGARAAVMMARPHFQPAQEVRYPLFADSHPGRFADMWQLSTDVYSSDGQYLDRGFIMCAPVDRARPGVRRVSTRRLQPDQVPPGQRVLDLPAHRDRHLRRRGRAVDRVRFPPTAPLHLTWSQ